MELENIIHFRNDLRQFLREIGKSNASANCMITEAQCHAILEIYNCKNMTLNQLANKLDLDKSTVSRTVENLHKMKLIKRVVNEQNRRMVKLSTTQKGVQLAQQINEYNNIYFSEIFNSIQTNELNEFLITFSKITHKMNLLNQQLNE